MHVLLATCVVINAPEMQVLHLTGDCLCNVSWLVNSVVTEMMKESEDY